jgi:serine/threonine-protein kinase
VEEPRPVVTSQRLLEGQVLQDRYEVLRLIGQGGMGSVFMARDLRLKGRPCVIKKLRDDFFREEDRLKARGFFEREMQVLSELRHPHIVQILDFFAENDDYFLVMEYVQGNNLYQMLRTDRQGEPFPQKMVVEWVEQVCEVLHYMHSQHPPVVYRDLKPSNIMIDTNNVVKLVDFGIARPSQDQGEHTHVVSAGYSPPEQYWGAVDTRSDIYSLGMTIYFLLTGKEPDSLKVCSPKTHNPAVTDGMDAIVRQATAQDINSRYQTIEEFVEALMHHDFVQAPTSPQSRVAEIITGIVIIALAVIIFLVEPMLQPDGHTSEKGKTTNATEAGSAPNAGGTPAADNSVDHAAEVNDEKDLTDPAGLKMR